MDSGFDTATGVLFGEASVVERRPVLQPQSGGVTDVGENW